MFTFQIAGISDSKINISQGFPLKENNAQKGRYQPEYQKRFSDSEGVSEVNNVFFGIQVHSLRVNRYIEDYEKSPYFIIHQNAFIPSVHLIFLPSV